MSRKQPKSRSRRPEPPAPKPVPARRVREMLLELTYRLHATRPVTTPSRPTGSVA